MRHLFALLIALCVAVAANATVYDKVVVHLNDGSAGETALGENLKMKFVGDDMVVTGTDADVTVARENIKSFEHKAGNSVEGIATEGGCRYTGDALEFSGLADGTAIVICDAAGKTVRSMTASGDCRVSLGDLPAGVYVVAAGRNSFKIFIR